MRVLMCGGGTGGHINPAVAIAKEIQSRCDAVVEFVGTNHGLETTLVPKAGYELHCVDVYGLKRKLALSNIKAFYKAFTSIYEAKKIIKKFKPDIVIGTGGYASWPTVRAAVRLDVPTLIQEQNAFPGVTTKKLAKMVDTVCISFEDSAKYFEAETQKKLVVTGNPVKANTIERSSARKKLGIRDDEIFILSSGGSLGADKVNTYALDAMEIYKDNKKIRQIHAVGHMGWQKFSKIAADKGLNGCKQFEIVEYIYDMPIYQSAADIVISRA
ncbi:MAG: UDP-N-acetylglucosamine--N-acetylmuramyl-(pentapeptide) pyrophosphoryl-undecaprenol N-acetylglucosamine transferase, partial [Clostridia bacterium]